MKKLVSMTLAGAVALSTMAVSTLAYDINKDLGIGWSTSATISADEFADITADSVITITYTADAALADMEGHQYWAFKPMINDEGWPLISGISQLTPTEDSSAYVMEVDGTSVSFTIPEESIEHLQTAGMAIIGHGVTLGTMTISDEPVETTAKETEATEETQATEETETTTSEPTDETTAETNKDTTEKTEAVTTAAENDKPNTNTGVEGVAIFVGLATIATGAIIVSKKRK